MVKEIIFEKEDYKCKVGAEINENFYRFAWLSILPKRKRKWQNVSKSWSDCYQYRKLNFDEKREYLKNKYLEYLTPEDILYVKKQLLQEFCEHLNPELDTNESFRC